MRITKKEVESGMYGLIVGDALGVPFEFLSRKALAKNPCVDMVGLGTHKQERGVWSDDSSMALATMDALTYPRDERYYAMMENFVAWLDKGAFSVNGAFDVGNTCYFAIMSYIQGTPPLQCGEDDEYSNGNGSLMRILPASLFMLAKGEDESLIEQAGSLTHAHPVSRTACKIYTDIVRAILSGKSKTEMFPITEIYNHKVFARLTQKSFYNAPESEIKSGGYVVESLEAALWCFYTTDSYKDCVLKAVNLGDDTDTTAAIAGSLAGLYYGKEGIPEEWLNALGGKDIIQKTIDSFCEVL